MGAESVQSIVKYMRKNGKAEEKGMKERKRKKGSKVQDTKRFAAKGGETGKLALNLVLLFLFRMYSCQTRAIATCNTNGQYPLSNHWNRRFWRSPPLLDPLTTGLPVTLPSPLLNIASCFSYLHMPPSHSTLTRSHPDTAYSGLPPLAESPRCCARSQSAANQHNSWTS